MIIIDTNVLLAFLLTDGITRRIIADNHDVFMSPEHCFEELWEHRFRWNKKKLQDRELLEIVDDVKRLFVMPVFPEVYDPYITAADKLTDDKDDAPVIALALSIDNEGIWTHNIKHFRQKRQDLRLSSFNRVGRKIFENDVKTSDNNGTNGKTFKP